MASMAHHMVVALIMRADGTCAYGEGNTFSHYCTLDAIGRQSVAKELRSRFPGYAVRVKIDGSRFYAELTKDGA